MNLPHYVITMFRSILAQSLFFLSNHFTRLEQDILLVLYLEILRHVCSFKSDELNLLFAGAAAYANLDSSFSPLFFRGEYAFGEIF